MGCIVLQPVFLACPQSLAWMVLLGVDRALVQVLLGVDRPLIQALYKLIPSLGS